MKNVTNDIASKYLGKKVEGSITYSSSFLTPIPREENRKNYDIDCGDLPFVGFDVWHGYEFSALTENGIPVTRVVKLRYSCDNDFLIESKSLKLYLNSFNMSKFGKNVKECLEICKSIIEKDLSEVLKTKVEVNFLQNNSCRVEIFSKFVNLMDIVTEEELQAVSYKETPEVLKFIKNDIEMEHYIMFDSLRSNCRVTHQPDFGDVFIYYSSNIEIDNNSLVEYLISFRSEYHFHEECCEMIFKRIFNLLGQDAKLLVSALYTRRGGIDICPSRWSKNCSSEEVSDLIDITKYARCGIKQ